MIPLIWALGAWLLFVFFFGFLALLTVTLLIRFGLASAGTYIASGLFLGVITLTLLGTGGYLLTVDWKQTVSVLPSAPTDTLLFP
jgi:hypothetical protein